MQKVDLEILGGSFSRSGYSSNRGHSSFFPKKWNTPGLVTLITLDHIIHLRNADLY